MLSNMLNKVSSLVFRPVHAALENGGAFDPPADSTTQLPGANPGEGNFDSLSSIMYFVINLVFVVGLGLALIFVIIGGIKYITSQGDEGKAAEARNTITNAVIGAVVIVGFRIILQLVLNVLGWQANIPGFEGQ